MALCHLATSLPLENIPITDQQHDVIDQRQHCHTAVPLPCSRTLLLQTSGVAPDPSAASQIDQAYDSKSSAALLRALDERQRELDKLLYNIQGSACSASICNEAPGPTSSLDAADTVEDEHGKPRRQSALRVWAMQRTPMSSLHPVLLRSQYRTRVSTSPSYGWLIHTQSALQRSAKASRPVHTFPAPHNPFHFSDF